MDIFDGLQMLGGLCLFLFGMNVMGAALERTAGSRLELFLARLTSGKWMGLLTGMAVTAVIQSSSATTVMVVGFVNSGLMQLSQAIHVIMGANIGTTVTAWILSLSGISGSNLFLKLLKPDSFTPILSLIGIYFIMANKTGKKKDIGTILLGFAVLMQGMTTMSKAVGGLAGVPEFQNILVMFENPLAGVLAGAVLTAIIQSSSASVGILQALSGTGVVTMGTAIPIIMGQNIGTCITALLSSFGTNRNARRAAMVHLCFNVIGTLVWLIVFILVDVTIAPALFSRSADQALIATAHTLFNIACTFLLVPASGLLEKLAYKIVPDTKKPAKITILDERLFATPAIALEQSQTMAAKMAESAFGALKDSLSCLVDFSPEKADRVREAEDYTDRCEDEIGSYLVKLSSNQITRKHSTKAASLLKVIGDLERIGDHALNLVESAEEMHKKRLAFIPEASEELKNMYAAIDNILNLTARAFLEGDTVAAAAVEPLEEVIDELKEIYRSSQIKRLQSGASTIEAGFVWSDILTNLERTSDHCSNIALTVLDDAREEFHAHESVQTEKELYDTHYQIFRNDYLA